jgi:hypothetical protein
MADSALAMVALRVVVYASRDDEMAALTRELVATRRAHFDLSVRFERMEARHEIARANDIAMLQQLELANAYSAIHLEREVRLTRLGYRLAQWAVHRSWGDAHMHVPAEVWDVVRLIRHDETDDETDDEADDDAEMVVDSTAAVP